MLVSKLDVVGVILRHFPELKSLLDDSVIDLPHAVLGEFALLIPRWLEAGNDRLLVARIALLVEELVDGRDTGVFNALQVSFFDVLVDAPGAYRAVTAALSPEARTALDRRL